MPVVRRQQTEIVELKGLFVGEPLVDFHPEVSSIWVQTKRLLKVALLFVGVTPPSVEIRSSKISNSVARFRCDCTIKARKRPIEIIHREVAQSSGHEPIRPLWTTAYGLIKIR